MGDFGLRLADILASSVEGCVRHLGGDGLLGNEEIALECTKVDREFGEP